MSLVDLLARDEPLMSFNFDEDEPDVLWRLTGNSQADNDSEELEDPRPTKRRRVSKDSFLHEYVRANVLIADTVSPPQPPPVPSPSVYSFVQEHQHLRHSDITERLDHVLAGLVDNSPQTRFLVRVGELLQQCGFFLLAALQPIHSELCGGVWNPTRITELLLKRLPVTLWRGNSKAGWLVLRRDLNPYAYLAQLATTNGTPQEDPSTLTTASHPIPPATGPTRRFLPREHMDVLLALLSPEAQDILQFVLYAHISERDLRSHYGWSRYGSVQGYVRAMEQQLLDKLRRYLAASSAADPSCQLKHMRRIALSVRSPRRSNRGGGRRNPAAANSGTADSAATADGPDSSPAGDGGPAAPATQTAIPIEQLLGIPLEAASDEVSDMPPRDPMPGFFPPPSHDPPATEGHLPLLQPIGLLGLPAAAPSMPGPPMAFHAALAGSGIARHPPATGGQPPQVRSSPYFPVPLVADAGYSTTVPPMAVSPQDGDIMPLGVLANPLSPSLPVLAGFDGSDPFGLTHSAIEPPIGLDERTAQHDTAIPGFHELSDIPGIASAAVAPLQRFSFSSLLTAARQRSLPTANPAGQAVQPAVLPSIAAITGLANLPPPR